MPSRFLQELSKRVLVFDGGMGTQIYSRNLSVETDYCGCENCTDILVKSRPDVIQDIHEDYLKAGADVVETDTFGANKLVLSEFDLTPQCYDLSKRGAEVARAACDKHSTSDKPRFVAGSMGPGTKLITLGNTHWAEMFDSYREQCRGMIAGGIDCFMIETSQDLLQVKCAIEACLAALDEVGKTAADIPILCSVTIETTGTMLLGSSIETAAAALAQYPITSLGLNCATGPTEMAEHVHWLGKNWANVRGRKTLNGEERRVSVLPNAGLPVLHEGKTEYPLKPQPFVEAMLKFVEEAGVNIVGGCCGTTPAHIKLLSEAVGSRPAYTIAKNSPKPGATSLYSVTDYRQDNSFLIVGERMNASGSRAFKTLLEKEAWDDIISLAREQVREGAHVLDLNVDYAGRDNVSDMAEIVKRVVRQVDAPLMIDSTQIKTIEAGLKHAGGKCIVNSANFEDGEEKFDQILEMCRTYGAAILIGSIDEDKQASMARTAERKYAIAERGFRRATEKFGMDPSDVMFDPLVLPISTGMESDRRSALELIEGIKRISAAFPESQTIVGLSNVSFGLNPVARVVLNSAFLHELREAGLTGAIVHASKILPSNKIDPAHWQAALDLIYDRRSKAAGGTGVPEGKPENFDPLQAFIEFFKDAQTAKVQKKSLADLPVEERMRSHIIDGEKQGLKECLDAALLKYKPLAIINDHLLEGMKTVGELFGSGKMQLPFVLQSAEVMKMAVAQLEPLMERVQGSDKGKIVLATVKGDVHDIGKNIVGVVLQCNNFDVIDLGVMVPAQKILDTARERNADIIGLSGLITPSLEEMAHVAHEMQRLGMEQPLLIGGATTSRVHTAVKIAPNYGGVTVYVPDASRAVGVASNLLSDELKAGYVIEVAADYEKIRVQHAGKKGPKLVPLEAARANAFATDWKHYAPPGPRATGRREFRNVDLAEIAQYIDWGPFFQAWELSGPFPAILDDAIVGEAARNVYAEGRAMLERIIAGRWLAANGVMALWPARAAGDDIEVFAEGDAAPSFVWRNLRQQNERPPGKANLCLADFIAPAGSGRADWIGGFAVTTGLGIERKLAEFEKAKDDYSAIMLKALADRLAEAFAEWLHAKVRRELWGYAPDEALDNAALVREEYRGIRPAPGYPACPDHAVKAPLFAALRAEALGLTLTESFAMLPTAAVSGFYFSHPDAQYFAVGRIGDDQLDDFAKREGISLEDARRRLAPNLG